MIEPLAEMSGLTVLAAEAGQGGYFSIAKIITIMIFIVPALIGAPWVHHDAKRVRTNQMLWSAVALGGVIAGFGLWLIVGQFIVGMLLYVVLAGAAFGVYIAHRNSKVDAPYRVFTSSHLSQIMNKRASKRAQVEVLTRCKLYSADNSPVLPPKSEGDPSEVAAYNLAQELLFDMLWRRASQGELVPKGPRAKLRYVIDGVVCKRDPLSLEDSQLLVDFLKKIGGMDLSQHRRPQKGLISVEMAGSENVDIMLSTAGTTEGQRLGIKVVQEVIQTHLDDLGMSETVLERLKSVSDKQGMIIVAGRGGAGVTSTLYSLLRSQDAYIKQLETLELKSAIDLENVTQNEYGRKEDQAGLLASALRHDPDVMMVDNCGDTDQAKRILEAAEKITIYLGMKATDSFTALAQWVKLCAGNTESVDILNAVLCQILVRKLCPNCREPYKPDPAMLAKANLPSKKIERFFRPPTKPLTDEKGNEIVCHQCQGSGYLGRVAVFELLEVTDEIRSLIHSGGNLAHIKTACRKHKMLYLQEQALRKVIQGQTSIPEVLRVTQPKPKSKAK